MNISRARPVKLLLIVIASTVAYSGCKPECECGGPQDLRTIRGILYTQEYPPSLDSLVNELNKRSTLVDGMKTWNTFYYTANVMKEDPPRLPIAMNAPTHENGYVLLKNGEILSFEQLGKSKNIVPDELVRKPWLLVQDTIDDDTKLKEIENRLKVIPPSKGCSN